MRARNTMFYSVVRHELNSAVSSLTVFRAKTPTTWSRRAHENFDIYDSAPTPVHTACGNEDDLIELPQTIEMRGDRSMEAGATHGDELGGRCLDTTY